jgi:hypothetical protein
MSDVYETTEPGSASMLTVFTAENECNLVNIWTLEWLVHFCEDQKSLHKDTINQGVRIFVIVVNTCLLENCSG